MLNLEVTSGSQKLVKEIHKNAYSLEVYVTSVRIKLNVPNGALSTNALVFGEDLLSLIEREFARKET